MQTTATQNSGVIGQYSIELKVLSNRISGDIHQMV